MRVRDIVAAVVSCFRQHDDEDEGQAMVEYALLLILIAVVSLTVMETVGNQVSAVFARISTALTPVS